MVRQNMNIEDMNKIRSELRDHSSNGYRRGIKVSSFLRNNNLKLRDFKDVILKHLKSLSDIAADSRESIAFCNIFVYRLTEKGHTKDISIPFDELTEKIDFEYIDIDNLDSINGECYIFLDDTLHHSFKRKFDEEFNPMKISAFSGTSNEFRELWDIISNQELPPIINKNPDRMNPLEHNAKLRRWIEAVIRQYPVRLTLLHQTINGIIPLGLYVDTFLEQEIIVFNNRNETSQFPLSKILTIEKHGDIPADSDRIAFSIDDYLAEKQTELIRLRVYHEANVGKKLQNSIGKDNLKIIIGTDYDIYEFKTVCALDYHDKLLGYGRSVIVEQPEPLRQKIITTTKEALNLYQNLLM